MFDLQFKKSIIEIHDYYDENNYKNNNFLDMIDKCFSIKKTTFYNWYNDKEIINYKNNYDNNNHLITKPIEMHVVNLLNKNKNIGIKKIKKDINNNFKINLNNKAISYILYKNNIKHKNIKPIDFYKEKKINNKILKLDEEQTKFILTNKDFKVKEINKLFNDKYNIEIHDKQILDIMHKNRIKTNSYYKLSDTIVQFIIDYVKKNIISTANDIKILVLKEFKIDISLQLIYNILKKNNFTYRKLRKNNNPYSIEEQVDQFKIIIKNHNEKNINNCISIDEMSFVLNSKPDYGWFLKNEDSIIKMNNKNIISKRFSILMAASNKKIIHYKLCIKGVKTDFFIDFMTELKNLDINNEKYYLLDNARVHKSKKFTLFMNENHMNVVYNAPYHSDTNPIENIFSMLRNNLNRNDNESIDSLTKSINDFIAIDNETKYKNIFNHSINTINEFIKKNDKKNN